VLQRTQDRLANELQTIAGRNTMQVDVPIMQNITQLAQNARRYLTSDHSRPMLARIEDFLDKIRITGRNSAIVEGRAYADLDSALATQIRGTGDGNARRALGELRDALRVAMDNSISAADAEAWQLARREYANFKTIQRAMNSPNAQTAAGNIPPAALSNAIATGPQRNYAMGRGDLNDLARVGRAFIQEAIPNSGTPERLAIQNLMTGGLAGVGGATGGLEGAALGMAAGLAGPRVAQSIYYAPLMQRYLTNQLAAGLLPGVGSRTLPSVAAGQFRPLMERVQ